MNSLRRLISKLLDYDIVVSEFELYFHYRI